MDKYLYPTTHSWRQAVAILQAHTRSSLVVFASIIAVSCAFLMLAPRKYQSRAQYLVRLGHESVSLDPVATVGETMGLYMTSDSIVRSTREILNSESLADKVVDKVGVNTILNRSPEENAIIAAVRAFWYSIDPISDKERARVKLRKYLGVTSPNQSNVISVHYQSPTAESAYRVMNAVSEAFLEEHGRINRTQGSLDFFEEQERFLSKALIDASEKLKLAKQQHGISSIDGKRTNLETQMTDTQSAMMENSRQTIASASRIEQLNKQLESTPEDVVLNATSGTDQQTSAAIRQQLYDLQLREKELISKFSPDHPNVRSVQAQLKEAEAILARLNLSDSATSRGANPIHQQLLLQLLTERANHSSLIAASEVLKNQWTELQNQLTALTQQEQEIFHLETQLNIAKTKYEAHAAKLEQARIEDELGSKAITSIGVIEAPRINERPASPDKVMTLVLGLALAIFAAGCTPFVIEYLRDEPIIFRTTIDRRSESGMSRVLVADDQEATVALESSKSP